MYTAVKPLSKYLQFKSVRIYDAIFTLHSKCTVALLVACTFLLSAKQYFGDPIQCISDLKDMDYVHSYCWTMGIYILNNEDDAARHNALRDQIQRNYKETHANHGLEHNLLYVIERVSPASNSYGDRTYLRYYQWVVLVLLLQSFVFYFPAFLWKMWEGGRLKHLCADFNVVLGPDEKSSRRISALVRYFTSDYKETHYRYYARYIICEILNFTISIINMLLLNVFLNGFWSRYVEALGAVPSYNWDTWNRITSRIFPKVAKCEVMKFGSSGSIETYDNLCLLPLNILNEKIFAFLWIWFTVMTALAGLKLIYRVLIICNRGLRFKLLRAQARFMPTGELQRALHTCNPGDWFVLMRVSYNISPEMFRELLSNLYKRQTTGMKYDDNVDNA